MSCYIFILLFEKRHASGPVHLKNNLVYPWWAPRKSKRYLTSELSTFITDGCFSLAALLQMYMSKIMVKDQPISGQCCELPIFALQKNETSPVLNFQENVNFFNLKNLFLSFFLHSSLRTCQIQKLPAW